MNYKLNKMEFICLALYSCAFPLSIILEQQFHIPHITLISLINLPFLVILGPLLMSVGNAQYNQLLYLLLSWGIIFIQAYLAFVFVKRRSENNGTSTTKAILSSVGRIGVIALATIGMGILALAYLFKTNV